MKNNSKKRDLKSTRLKVLNKYISTHGRSFVEIGAQCSPTLTKNEADISYLDYETKEQSCKNNFGNNPDLWDKVVDTDIVVSSDEYSKFAQKQYDCVIANHVIEHTNDPIGWMNSISNILNDDGILFLSIPDKKYSFDKYRQCTTISHLIADSFSKGKSSEKEHIIDISLFYDKEYIGQQMNLKQVLCKSFLDEQCKRTAWIGLHRHVFEAESFENKVLAPILYSGYTDFKIIHCDKTVADYGEFYCVLKKGRQVTFDTNNLIMENRKRSEEKFSISTLGNKLVDTMRSIISRSY